jgi:hypothetical protein
MAQEIECLSSQYKVLRHLLCQSKVMNSNPNTIQKKKKKRIEKKRNCWGLVTQEADIRRIVA